MATVLQSMVDLTIIIDCHCRGTKPIKEFTPFIDRRNSVQHSLMSLPSGDELLVPEDKVKSIALYESIRHAALIYSAAVTFPLPALSGHFHKLAATWILILGGIAASDTKERDWFVRSISIVAKILKIGTWEEVAEIVESFLWLESACGPGGRILWAEVTRGRLLRSRSE